MAGQLTAGCANEPVATFSLASATTCSKIWWFVSPSCGSAELFEQAARETTRAGAIRGILLCCIAREAAVNRRRIRAQRKLIGVKGAPIRLTGSATDRFQRRFGISSARGDTF